MPSNERLVDSFMTALAAAVAELSLDDQVRAFDAIERMMQGTPLERSVVAAILDGDVLVAGFDADGQLMLRLTRAGAEAALDAMHRSPRLRAMVERMTGRAIGDPPKRPQ